MASKVIEILMQTQKAKGVSELRGWARIVGRFLLNAPTSDLRMEQSVMSLWRKRRPEVVCEVSAPASVTLTVQSA